MVQKNVLQKKVIEFITKNSLLSPKESVLVALSGGIDSTVLFHVLVRLEHKLKIKIGAVHVDHGVRSDSKENADFAIKLAEEAGKKCALFHARFSPIKQPSEEEMRKKRYEIFAQAMEEGQWDKIATAHTANDSAETFIYNLARGAGFKGLSGIPVLRDKIIRPLLCCTSKEIENYAKENDLTWYEDYTNQDITFSRNRIRYRVLPELEKINSKVIEHIVKTADIVSAFAQLIESVKQEIKAKIKTNPIKIKSNFKIDLDKFNQIEIQVLPFVLLDLMNLQTTSEHIKALKQLIFFRNGTKTLDFQRNITVQREYSYLFIRKKQVHNNFANNRNILNSWQPMIVHEPNINDMQQLKIEHLGVISIFLKPTEKQINFNLHGNFVYFDMDQLRFPLILRAYQTGDKIKVFGSENHKKLSDLFINMKIPKIYRPIYPVLLSNNEIIWVPGIRRSSVALVTTTAKSIICFSFDAI